MHDCIAKQSVEALVGFRGNRCGGAHYHQGMPLKAGVIGRVHMRKIIGKEPATLIKTFASHGNIIKRRIDFQDDGKVMCGQHVQNSLAIAPVTKFGPDAQMLDIDQGVCLPKQGKANKGGRIKNKTEAVIAVRQDAVL